MIVVILGKPCSGKGTLAKLLVDDCNLYHISTGNLLRDNNMTNSSGKLVSDDIVNDLVSKCILEHENVILDGYPRTMQQHTFIVDFLEQHNLKIDDIFNIEVSDDIAINRMCKRKSEENRLDDNLDTFHVRLEEFNKNTKPMIEAVNCFNVSGEKKPIEVFDIVKLKLKK
ncbi:MAG: AAA family ATPase [Actinobacteria bacterium]|nr:AAA family ATPase [Actinomycetota bacterium]